MANNINWGEIYCDSWFGDEDNEQTIHIDSQPNCFI
jgi:hypothetical protein